MIIFGISFLDQTGNFLLSSYIYRWRRGEGQRRFSFWGGGGGRDGWESIVHSVPVKNDNVFLSIGSFFFSYLVQLMVTIYHFPCIVYLKRPPPSHQNSNDCPRGTGQQRLQGRGSIRFSHIYFEIMISTLRPDKFTKKET